MATRNSTTRAHLKSLLEPFIFEELTDATYEVKSIPADKLLTWNRLIIAFDLFYLDFYKKNKVLAKKVYSERVRATTLGSFTELGQEKDKNSFQCYLNAFHTTFKSIKHGGFDENKSLIPVALDGSILNGAHRVASAIFSKKNVSYINTGLEEIVDDYHRLHLCNISPKFLDIAATQFIEYSDNTYIAFLWPSGLSSKKETESKFSKIVYKKQINLTPKGAFNLLVELYKHMDWAGTEKDGFSGTQQKLIECFPDFNSVTIIAFQADSLADVRVIKTQVRDIYNIGYSSIHITDTHEEAIRISRLIFNRNSLHFLNHANPYKYSHLHRELNQFKKIIKNNQLDPRDIIIDGSFILSLYGIRKSQDIDYILANDKKFLCETSEFESHENQLIFHNEKKENLIYNPDFYFYFQGVKFISFFQLYEMKENRMEEKDKNDCDIMAAFLSNDKFRESISGLKQTAFYFRIKVINYPRRIIINILKPTRFYAPLKKLYRRLKKQHN